jgi:hypothetical protein
VQEVSTSGAVTLGDIADKITMVEVACSWCERHGRLSVALGMAVCGRLNRCAVGLLLGAKRSDWSSRRRRH